MIGMCVGWGRLEFCGVEGGGGDGRWKVGEVGDGYSGLEDRKVGMKSEGCPGGCEECRLGGVKDNRSLKKLLLGGGGGGGRTCWKGGWRVRW